MSSKLQALLIKYQKDVNEQKNLKMNQGVAGASDAKRCELIANHAMSLIAILCLDQSKINTIGPKKIEEIANRLLIQKSTRQRVQTEKLKKTIGLFFMDFFEENPDLESIKSEFQIIYEDDQEIEPEQSEICDEDDFRTMLSQMNLMNPGGQIQSTQGSINNISIESKSSAFKRQNKGVRKETDWGKNPFEMKVTIYLSQLSAPQAQLAYLCQSMGWNWNFTDIVGESCTQFTTTATVNFQYKNVKKELVQSYKVNNKKKGRMITSYLLLRKIYFSYPAIWDLFETVKKQKSLFVPKDQNNFLLKQQVIIEDHELNIEEPLIQDKVQFEIAKREYLRDIVKYKAQINLITQQNSSVFTYVKLDKLQDLKGRWSVKGTMTYKMGEKITQFKEIVAHPNSKTAQEAVAKALSLKIFDTYPQILEKMIMIKKKKGIRT